VFGLFAKFAAHIAWLSVGIFKGGLGFRMGGLKLFYSGLHLFVCLDDLVYGCPYAIQRHLSSRFSGGSCGFFTLGLTGDITLSLNMPQDGDQIEHEREAS
jgi:hypothetical protein